MTPTYPVGLPPGEPPSPERALQVQEVASLPERGGYPQTAPGGLDQADDTIDLRALWGVLLRRRGIVIAVAAITVAAALLWSFLATPIYRSSVLLQIERESDKVVEYQTVTPENTGDTKDFYQTQYELLKSRTLARRVIDQLGLRSSQTFAPPAGPSFVRDLLAGLTNKPSDGAQGDAAASTEPDLETIFLRNLTVTPVKNSRLVRIQFDSPSPTESAEIANAIAENFVNTTIERRYDASSYAKTFLQERLQKVRVNLEDSERRLVAYAKEREIINPDDKLAILMDRLKELSKQQVTAEAERIAAESQYQLMVQQGNRDTSESIENPVIQTLKGRLSALTSEYREKLEIFKPGYPKMQQLREQIDEVERQIARESANVGTASRATFEAKVRQEAKFAAGINDLKAEILALQDRSTDYQTLKREVDTNRQLYDGLLQRMKEVAVVAGIGTNNISVVDAAEVPQEKFKPKLKQNLAIALLLGVFGGAGLAFLIETLDDSVKSTEEAERCVGAPVLTLVPWMGSGKGEAADGSDVALMALRDPKSALAEAYRSLRTSLTFATSEGAPRVMHFTSSGPGEGKTTSACATAIAFSQNGSKVLLVDCDLRNPSLHKVFAVPNSEGLTNYLTGAAEPAQVALPTEGPRLFVIPSGPLPPNPVELLASPRMVELVRVAAERFDYVILDGPPALGLSDAPVLANLARATLVVVESSGTRVGALMGSVRRLRAANANILGAVLVKHGRGAVGYGYGYDYHYTYTYGSSGQESPSHELRG